MNIKPILNDNTWREIIWASENNCIPDTWKIGDEIDLTLSGYFDEVVTLQIWDFNHYDKSDGTGKAHILFGMKDLMIYTMKMNSSFNTNKGGWNSSYMKYTIMNNIYNSIPAHIRNYIKEVNTYANAGNYSKNESKGLLSTDKVFIPGLSEIDNEWESQNQTETGQTLISIFKDKKNRIKRSRNGSGEIKYWWTRSPYYANIACFCIFDYSGSSAGYYASSRCGVCFCFNI